METRISNGIVQASVKHLGAELSSLVLLDKGKEFIWEGTPLVWARHAPILFPIVGRLKGDGYKYNGVPRSLSQHGFARDSHFALIKEAADEVHFRLSATEKTLAMYPFRFTLDVQYKVVGKTLISTFTVQNKDFDTQLFSIGAHPGFKLHLGEREKVSSYTLHFQEMEDPAYLLSHGLLNGETAQHMVDKKIALSDSLFNQDALVYIAPKSSWVLLQKNDMSHAVKVSFQNFPYLGIWSRPNGAHFVCIEPWYGLADTQDASGELSEKPGLLALAPDTSFSCSYSIELIN